MLTNEQVAALGAAIITAAVVRSKNSVGDVHVEEMYKRFNVLVWNSLFDPDNE